MAFFAEVVVTLPVEGRFHYAIPDELRERLSIGHRVLVPFGRRRATAFVVALSNALPPGVGEKLKVITECLDSEPVLPEDVLALATFAADYYLGTVGEALRLAMPPGLTGASIAKFRATRAGRRMLKSKGPLSNEAEHVLSAAAKGGGVRAGLVPAKIADELESLGFITKEQKLASLSRRSKRASGGTSEPAGAEDTSAFPPERTFEIRHPLTEEQSRAVGAITARLDERTGGAFLLHGVTGSGKTEVYLASIEHARKLGLGAIVLVPEIALTPQLEARFRGRFGGDVAVLHSALPDGERRRRWETLRRGDCNIALGPRSAVWAPVQRAGVIIVDEEHDTSFKQGSDLRYNGRDLALTRAHQARGVAILGSATPSLETSRLSRTGRIIELRLGQRVEGRPMPTVEVVDLQEERRAAHGELRILSRVLSDRLRAILGAGEQAILFLNRRGFNTVVYCEDCGSSRLCAQCDVSMTHHKAEKKLICHYCGHSEPLDAPCRACGGLAMQPFGVGTERVFDAVKEAAPDARVLRLDRDVTTRRGELDRTLDLFRRGEANVLVGTQMVAKGHDFPGVTLVGIVLADASLAFPDFRAAERTFQLVTQVAGRAGRRDTPGHVVIQTFQRDHYALVSALTHDSDRFFEIESAQRMSAGFPPFSRMGLIRLESKDPALLSHVAVELRRSVERRCPAPEVGFRGPAPAPIARIRERHRQMLMILAPTPGRLVAVMRRIQADMETVPKKVDIIFDVDPIDLL